MGHGLEGEPGVPRVVSEAEQHKLDTYDALVEALKDSHSALQWASGSPDFNTGGTARTGWLRIGWPAIERASAVLNAVDGIDLDYEQSRADWESEHRPQPEEVMPRR